MMLHELFSLDKLDEMIAAGYVRRQVHPTLPLAVLNYTAAAQYDRAWNDVTRQCRGLIIDTDYGSVVARPWPKFHNYGEHDADTLDLAAEVVVRDKLDGSLGIMYPDLSHPSGYAIATRGSFTSDQAIRGTAMLQEYLTQPRWAPVPGVTYLFEIIYPENRIVVNYEGRSELVLLGVVNNETGATDHGDATWPGPIAPFIHAPTLADALALEPRDNAEGVVVYFKDTGEMLKIKQDDYVALHKLVTGLNERTVWEHLANGGELSELMERLPDEFHRWVQSVADVLIGKRVYLEMDAREVFADLIMDVSMCGNRDWTRKDFALKAAKLPNPQLLFMLLDDKDITDATWRMVRPTVTQTLLAITEDNA